MASKIQPKTFGVILMIASAICACLGQLFWKLSVANSINLIILFIGFFFYAAGAILMIISYRYGPVSVLQPVLSCSYVISIIIGAFFLEEQITIRMIIGAGVVIFGVYLIAKAN